MRDEEGRWGLTASREHAYLLSFSPLGTREGRNKSASVTPQRLLMDLRFTFQEYIGIQRHPKGISAHSVPDSNYCMNSSVTTHTLAFKR